jgi:hypothetical protein
MPLENETATAAVTILTPKTATPLMYGGSFFAIVNGIDANTIQFLGLVANIIGVVGGLVIGYAGYRINRRDKLASKIRHEAVNQKVLAEIEARTKQSQELHDIEVARLRSLA